MKGKRTALKRIITVICVVALLATALMVPVSFSAFAESSITTCTFETAVSTADTAKNEKEVEKSGVGYYGWGPTIDKYDGDNVLATVHSKAGQNWNTAGGYRLNDNGNCYNLKADTSYVVSLKVMVVKGPMSIAGSNASPAVISLGYGAAYDETIGGNKGNYVNKMTKKISDIFSAGKDSKNYTLYSGGSSETVAYDTEWKNVYYTFTTPSAAELGSADMALAVFASLYYGVEAYIDDVMIVEVAEGEGAVLLNDVYSNTHSFVFEKLGENAELPDISDLKNRDDHKFLGWYFDKELTQPAEEVVAASDVTVVYSKWEAPVTYTFKDTLSNKDITVKGEAGKTLTIPADLVDEKGENWFMGWFETTDYLKEFTKTTFGYTDKTLYSKWLQEIPVLSQDFENYDKDQYQVVDDNGYKVKNNRLYFSMMMEKQSEETYGESGNAIKFTWDKNMTKTPDNPSSYVAASRYNQMDMYVWLGTGLSNNENYIINFKYKVEKADTNVTFYAVTARGHNIWDSYKLNAKTVAVGKDAEGKGWQEASFEFIPEYKNETANHVFFAIKLEKNENVTLYFDDIEVKAKAQPYESYVTVEPNNGQSSFNVTGKRGEEVVLPTLTHSEGAEFIGWYLDKNCKTEFTGAVFERFPITVYAKWGSVPVTFKNYSDKFFATQDNCGFGKELYIDDSGVGIDDDYALHLNYRGDHLYKYAEDGTFIGMNTRYNQLDSLAQIARNLTDKTSYRLTFYIKVLDANTDLRIRFFSGHTSNIWVAGDRTEYAASVRTVSADTNEWTKVTTTFTSDIKGNGSALYLVFNFTSANLEDYANVLVDNVKLEEVAPPYIMFDAQNGDEIEFFKGKVGEKIPFPANPKKFGSTFTGWYVDKECTQKFTETTFTKQTGLTVYAGYTLNNSATYTFEKYDLKPNALAPGKYHMEDAVLKKVGGNTVVEFDRTGTYNKGVSCVAIAHGVNIAQVKKDQTYIFSFRYRLTKACDETMSISVKSAHLDNMWAYGAELTSRTVLGRSEGIGEWKTAVWFLDTSKVSERNGILDNALYFNVFGGKGGIIQIDDVTVTMVPKGKSAVAINTGGSSAIPTALIGNEGQYYASKLPNSPTVKGKKFVGYFKKDTAGKYIAVTKEDMKFSKEPTLLYARFFNEKVEQNFDGEDFRNAVDQYNGFTVFDFDYELYDSQIEGNSKDNVTSGRYSLHRKGDSRHVEASILLTLGKNISEASRYTVTMKVKVGKHFHTDGAIKIASGRNYYYPWTTTGDSYPVVPISEIADGQWHEVSYTFNSVEGFVSLMTPGYVELFIDDVVFTLADENTPLSTPKEFTEYVTAERDENGNLIGIFAKPIDVDSIIDVSLEKQTPVLLIIGIGAGALIVVALVVILLIARKKKKA